MHIYVVFVQNKGIFSSFICLIAKKLVTLQPIFGKIYL